MFQTDGAISGDDPRIEAGYRRLKAYWDAIGPSDTDVIAYLINPQFHGAPAWPNTRQAYRVVRPAGSLVIASDGMSDPFVGTDMTGQQGFGCEVYIEAPELAAADFQAIQASWAFALIETVAQNVAYVGGLSTDIERHGTLSMELPLADRFPGEWLTASGTVGCLINLPVAGRPGRIADMPFGPVDICCVRLLTPAQLGEITAGGRAARNALAERLGQQPGGHASRLGA
jgi:hypothetical protein